MATKIEWTDETWNPITGCTKISEACKHCYAERMSKRLAGRCGYPTYYPFKVTLHEDKLDEPLRWKKPRQVFVCSMGDLFHEDVPIRWFYEVYKVMEQCKHHTFLVLTKRPQRMANVLEQFEGRSWPLSNVWLGVTAENQQRADERIPVLLQIPAAVRFVSVEPMLGPVDLRKWMAWDGFRRNIPGFIPNPNYRGLNWVICGGETGPGARPMHPDWARSLRDQCQQVGVPFFFKQWGEWSRDYIDHDKKGVVSPDGWWAKGWPFGYGSDHPDSIEVYKVGKKAAGHLLDGREWREFPKEAS